MGAQEILNERMSDVGSAPFSLSISRWSYLHLYEIGVTRIPMRPTLAYFDNLLHLFQTIYL